MSNEEVTIDMFNTRASDIQEFNTCPDTSSISSSSQETLVDNEVQPTSESIHIDDNTSSEGDPECTICMSPLSQAPEGERVVLGTRTLECNHTFHTHCIDRWLAQNSHCPLCRQNVFVARTVTPTTRNPVDIPALLVVVRPELRRIMIRQIITAIVSPVAYIYEVATDVYISSYALLLLFFMNILTIGILVPFVKEHGVVTMHTIVRAQEVFSNLPFLRIIVLTLFIASRLLELNILNSTSYFACITTTMSLADDFLTMTTIIPVRVTLDVN